MSQEMRMILAGRVKKSIAGNSEPEVLEVEEDPADDDVIEVEEMVEEEIGEIVVVEEIEPTAVGEKKDSSPNEKQIQCVDINKLVSRPSEDRMNTSMLLFEDDELDNDFDSVYNTSTPKNSMKEKKRRRKIIETEQNKSARKLPVEVLSVDDGEDLLEATLKMTKVVCLDISSSNEKNSLDEDDDIIECF